MSDNTELMALMGQATGDGDKGEDSPFPFMKIQMDDADNEGRDVPRGSYRLYFKNPKEGENEPGYIPAYAKQITFIPLVNSFNYRVWSQKDKKFSAQSIIFKNWKQDIFSSNGQLACGKVSPKVREGLSEAEQAKQAAIRCVRNLFGLVSGTFTAADGVEFVADNMPVVFQSGGRSFRTIGDAIDKLTHAKKLICTHPWTLTTTRVKTGGNSSYEATPIVDEAVSKDVDKAWFEHIKQYNEWMDAYNRVIKAQWDKHQAKKNDVASVPADVTKELSRDFDDDLSPLMAG